MSRNVLRLFWISLLLVSACAPGKVELPSFPGGDIRSAIAEKKAVTDMEATFSITFEKADTAMHGDGALTIADTGDLDLRVYSLGFLAMELTSRDGVVRSKPPLDAKRKTMLTVGLKDCIFWWNMEGFSVDEDGDAYIIRNRERTVWVDKMSFLPVRQVVHLAEGKDLRISYQNPVKMNGRWVQSQIRIEYVPYAVSLTVNSLGVRPAGAVCVYCSL
ncbi:MAG: hypothetical protein M0024_01045 [Nitrospiraceae bacterium]|nr:hypothetical protein [Nitrospiraceae bacterium]